MVAFHEAGAMNAVPGCENELADFTHEFAVFSQSLRLFCFHQKRASLSRFVSSYFYAPFVSEDLYRSGFGFIVGDERKSDAFKMLSPKQFKFGKQVSVRVESSHRFNFDSRPLRVPEHRVETATR